MITLERARKLRRLIEQGSISLDDESALEGVELFPNWETDYAYSVGDRVQHEDVLYKCVQAHTSQDSWTPDLTPALWTKVSVDEFPEWVQPTGAQDAYSIGDKVSYDGKRWISEVDANVWKPGVYGWGEVNA
jgi:chitodextrinase